MLRIMLIFLALSLVNCKLKLPTYLITLKVGESTTFQVGISNAPISNVTNNTLTCTPEHEGVIQVSPTTVLITSIISNKTTNSTYNFSVTAITAGKSGIIIRKFPSDTSRHEQLFILVQVYRTIALQWLSNIVGWMYSLCWSFYYYPQIYTNYKRKSVVGLNFDYLLFGIFGYLMYDSFNVCLYVLPAIQEQYSEEYPRSIIPVEANDILSATHSIWGYSLTIFQCFIYERGNQKISVIAKIIFGVYILAVITSAIMASLHVILWLDTLYLCSYIKLCINLTLYIPQVYMNYKRKSTQGWSIGGALLDVSGGFLSILQMVLNGYNYADWKSVIANPTKLGVGILTMTFSSMFMVQHFILYRK